MPSTDFTVAAWFNWTTNPSPYYGGIHGGGGSWELRVMADGRFGATFYQSIGPDVCIEEVTDLGDRVLVSLCWTISGQHSGAEGEQRGSVICTFREGRVILEEFFLEHDQALKAVGLED